MDRPHKMPVMVVVAVVVPEHTPVVQSAYVGVHVRKTVPHDFPVRTLPNLFLQH